MSYTLNELNAASLADFVQACEGIYEHSPWVPERAAAKRPFADAIALRQALFQVVLDATHDEQLTLLRAHPELAGRASLAGTLTAESTSEQSRAGLTHCTAQQMATLQRLNTEYNKKFGFHFILAVRGPTGQGLSREEIIGTFERRAHNLPQVELDEALRQVERIAELRLQDRVEP